MLHSILFLIITLYFKAAFLVDKVDSCLRLLILVILQMFVSIAPDLS